MVAVKERLNRIAKLRKLLGMKYDRSIEVEINTLALENLNAIRSFIGTEAFEIVEEVLRKTAEADDSFVLENALTGDKELLAYHKAVAHVCRKILKIFDIKKIREAADEMRSRNEVLTEEVPSGVGNDSHFLSIVGRLENARE